MWECKDCGETYDDCLYVEDSEYDNLEKKSYFFSILTCRGCGSTNIEEIA